MLNKKLTLSVIAIMAASGGTAHAAGKLNLYCSTQEEWCQAMARGFEDATGIDVDMTRKSSASMGRYIVASRSVDATTRRRASTRAISSRPASARSTG